MGHWKLEPMNKMGLFPKHDEIIPPVYNEVRMTIPAREALERAGHSVEVSSARNSGDKRWAVVLCGKKMPANLVAVIIPSLAINGGYFDEVGLRLFDEPEFPDESSKKNWQTAAWLGCPKCSAPLVWYEAGFVPGYRVCCGKKHHHSMIVVSK